MKTKKRRGLKKFLSFLTEVARVDEKVFDRIDMYKLRKALRPRCRKHFWKPLKVKPLFEVDLTAGAVNYYFGEELIIQICVHCRKIKN